MDPRTQTDLFLIAWVAAAVVWDVLVLLLYGPEATISARVLDWSLCSPWLRVALLLGLGILLGHLFVSQKR